MKSEWYLYDKLVGESDIKMTHTKGESHIPYSLTRVCWKCGEAWSKIKVIHSDTKWIAHTRLCPKCGPGVMNEHNDELYILPQSLALREFQKMNDCKVDYEIHLVTGGCEEDLK